jgi:hypothetical protein
MRHLTPNQVDLHRQSNPSPTWLLQARPPAATGNGSVNSNWADYDDTQFLQILLSMPRGSGDSAGAGPPGASGAAAAANGATPQPSRLGTAPGAGASATAGPPSAGATGTPGPGGNPNGPPGTLVHDFEFLNVEFLRPTRMNKASP